MGGQPKKKRFNKKWVIIAIVVFLAFAWFVGDDGEESSSNSSGTQVAVNDTDGTKELEKQSLKQEIADDGIVDLVTKNIAIKYTRHEFSTDYEGKPVLVYYYTFSNTGENNASAVTSVHIQCFQNGVSCESALSFEENECKENYMKSLQPGGSIEVCETFVLNDNSEITIEAAEAFSFENKKDMQKILVE